jgi:hypothetical protein
MKITPGLTRSLLGSALNSARFAIPRAPSLPLERPRALSLSVLGAPHQRKILRAGGFCRSKPSCARRFRRAMIGACARDVAARSRPRRLRERRFNVPVQHPSRPQVPCNPEFALPPDFRALPHKLFCEPFVIDHLGALQAVHHGSEKVVVFCSLAEQLLHFVCGICPPHQRAHRRLVQFRFGFHSSSLSKHVPSIGAGGVTVKEKDFGTSGDGLFSRFRSAERRRLCIKRY